MHTAFTISLLFALAWNPSSNPVPVGTKAPGPSPLSQSSDVLSCSWLPGFQSDFPDAAVFDSVVFDDGGGPALFVAGEFRSIGSTVTNRIAKWDGSSWSALGSGADDDVHTLVVYDDGTGPALYAGGEFETIGGQVTGGIAKWDGSTWSPLGPGTDAPWVYDLVVFENDGDRVLVAVGNFASIGGVSARSVAAWDGASWSALGGGIQGIGLAALVLEDRLYVGGLFSGAGGTSARDIAAWDGTSWFELGASLPSGFVWSLALYDHGTGPRIHVASSSDTLHVWDGATWLPLGAPQSFELIRTFTVHSDSGQQLLASGIEFLGRRTVPKTLVWTDGAWSPWTPAPGLHPFAVARFGTGGNDVTYLGGQKFHGEQVSNFVRRGSQDWEPVVESESTPGQGFDDDVLDFAVFDDGNGPKLYAAGLFKVAGRLRVPGVARWSDGAWQAVGGGLEGSVRSLAVYDSGSGPELYAGGSFSIEPANVSSAVYRVAKWDGASWTAVGTGGPSNGTVEALAVYDLGDGPRLAAGGSFTSLGDVEPVGYAASWDGATWTELGGGLPDVVHDLVAFEDTDGRFLIAAGSFSEGPVDPSGIARWNGTFWDFGSDGVLSDGRDLAVLDEGSGARLFVSGFFEDPIDGDRPKLSVWSGPEAGWSDRTPPFLRSILTLEIVDFGEGPALFASGPHQDSALYGRLIVRWNGAAWDAIPSDVGIASIRALATLDLPEGRALVAGGLFRLELQPPSTSIAVAVECGTSRLFGSNFETGTTQEWSYTTP